MKEIRGRARTMSSLWLLLALLITGLPARTAPVGQRLVLVQDLGVMTQTGLNGETLFVVRAKALLRNCPQDGLSFEVTMRRSDGTPLHRTSSAPSWLTERNGSLVYTWIGPDSIDMDVSDLFAPIPVPAVAYHGSPFSVDVRCKIMCAGMSGYLDGRTTFPFPGQVQTFQMMDVSSRRTVQQVSTPNVAGMDVSTPNTISEDERQTFALSFGVSGVQGQPIYAGAAFRFPDGESVSPSDACPKGNIGSGNRVQVQRSETVTTSPASWNQYPVQVPVEWMEVDRSTDQVLVAGVYVSSVGLWGYGELEWTLPARKGTEDDAPALRVAPSARTLSRYTVPLRDILIELKDVNRKLKGLQESTGTPDQDTVRALGQELARIGGSLGALFGDRANTALTRVGLVEDLDLFRQIDSVQEEAADRFMSMAVLPQEAKDAMRPAQSVTMLQQVGRDLIEKEVTQWITRRGFGELLADDGCSVVSGKVNKRLQLDLNGYLEKKSMEIAGMPLRGFTSMKAAMQLQARRKIRNLVSELVMDFTGNRLVLMLLQNTILDWAENQLWPHLREAFRPKGNLAYRVDVSEGTMEQARRRLFNLSKDRDPGLVPLDEVVRELDRAAGTVNATRYLEKDLRVSGDENLRGRFNRERDNLSQAMRVVMGQFLLYEEIMGEEGEGRISQLNDLSEHIEGIHGDVTYVLSKMKTGLHEMRIWHPASGELGDGRYRFKPEHFQPFHVALYKLPQDQLNGIKRLIVWIHDQQFVLYGKPDMANGSVEFRGKLPMPVGNYTVRLECPDIAGVPREELLVRVEPDGSSQKRDLLGRVEQKIRQKLQQASGRTGDARRSALHSVADEYRLGGSHRLEMGDAATAGAYANEGINLIMQSGSPYSSAYLAGLYEVQAVLALMTGNRNGYVGARQKAMSALDRYLQYRAANPGQFAWSEWDARNINGMIAYRAMETAELILEMGADPSQAKPYVDAGMQYASRSNQQHMSISRTWPNVAIVFQLNQ